MSLCVNGRTDGQAPGDGDANQIYLPLNSSSPSASSTMLRSGLSGHQGFPTDLCLTVRAPATGALLYVTLPL